MSPSSSRAEPSPLLLGPALVLFGCFALLPMLGAVVLSFTKWNGLGTPVFTGLSNWARLGSDPLLGKAIGLSLVVMAGCWVLQTPVSLLLGTFVAARQRYRAVLAACFFVPLLLSSTAIAIMFKDMLDPNFGLFTHLSWLNQQWLGGQHLVVFTLIFVMSWQYIPLHILLYQAGNRQIPRSLYEAATLDGAGRLGQFRHVTLPQLRNTMVTSTTLILVGSVTSFDMVFVLTGGGPGTATRVLPLHMYLTGFSSYDMGYASAIAVVLLGFGLAISLALIKFTGFGRMRSTQEGLA